jgi:hypothetical protein
MNPKLIEVLTRLPIFVLIDLLPVYLDRTLILRLFNQRSKIAAPFCLSSIFELNERRYRFY